MFKERKKNLSSFVHVHIVGKELDKCTKTVLQVPAKLLL